MIRLDEIYSNTFWSWIKKNKELTRMFFCDPPGTTDVCNLFNYGNKQDKNYVEEKDYIFFHDQEPIHFDVHIDLFDCVKERTTEISKSNPVPGHFVHSEWNSEAVKQIEEEFGWIPHYYFFHGWAAMDWYRGYDKTFMLKNPEERLPTKTFVSPNRIIGGKRDHRVLFLYEVFKNNLHNNHISCPEVCPEEHIHINEVAEKYLDTYPDIMKVFDNADLPRLFQGEESQIMSSCFLTNFHEVEDSLFYVPTETLYFGKRVHLTEKTFKPIVYQTPFILVANAHSLEYLKMYGFKTFDGIIDESYDSEENDLNRLKKVGNLLTELNNLSVKERQQIHKHCIPIVKHNYNHFYNGNFENILWKELINMMKEW